MAGSTRQTLMTSPVQLIAALGARVRNSISGMGAFMRLAGAILVRSDIVFKLPGLFSPQIHFIGTYSLLILAVSGPFVGFVLGLQGYYTLICFRSAERPVGKTCFSTCRSR